MQTIYDFEDKVLFEYQIMIDKSYYKLKKENRVKFYEKTNERYGETIYEEIEDKLDVEWHNAIAKRKPSGSLVVHDVFKSIE